MPYGPYFTDLPSDSQGKRYVNQAAWDALVDNWVNWKGDQNAGGHSLTNLAQLHGHGTTNILAFYTGGQERMRIAADGNVAIGTAETTMGRLTVSGGPIVGQGLLYDGGQYPSDPTKGEFLTYNWAPNNWAGIGGYTDSGMWFRSGMFSFWVPTASTTVAVFAVGAGGSGGSVLARHELKVQGPHLGSTIVLTSRNDYLDWLRSLTHLIVSGGIGSELLLGYTDAGGSPQEVFRVTQNARMKFNPFTGFPPAYANNAAAVAGGLTVGEVYRDGGDPDHLCVVH